MLKALPTGYLEIFLRINFKLLIKSLGQTLNKTASHVYFLVQTFWNNFQQHSFPRPVSDIDCVFAGPPPKPGTAPHTDMQISQHSIYWTFRFSFNQLLLSDSKIDFNTTSNFQTKGFKYLECFIGIARELNYYDFQELKCIQILKNFKPKSSPTKSLVPSFRDIIGLGLKSDVIISQETWNVNLVSLDMNFVNHEKWIETQYLASYLQLCTSLIELGSNKFVTQQILFYCLAWNLMRDGSRRHVWRSHKLWVLSKKKSILRFNLNFFHDILYPLKIWFK